MADKKTFREVLQDYTRRGVTLRKAKASGFTDTARRHATLTISSECPHKRVTVKDGVQTCLGCGAAMGARMSSGLAQREWVRAK